MSKRKGLLLGVCVFVVLALVVVVAAACGGTSTTTTTAAVTTTTEAMTTTTAGGGGTTTSAAQTTTSGASVDAAALFATNCKGCHANGIQADSAATAVQDITNGVGSSMPAFAGKLSDAEISALADYIQGGGM